MDRRTGRTSKTTPGARRRTILASVFESLRLHLSEFTLPAVLQEIHTWSTTGTSLFERLLKSSGLAPPPTSTLANLLSTAHRVITSRRPASIRTMDSYIPAAKAWP